MLPMLLGFPLSNEEGLFYDKTDNCHVCTEAICGHAPTRRVCLPEMAIHHQQDIKKAMSSRMLCQKSLQCGVVGKNGKCLKKVEICKCALSLEQPLCLPLKISPTIPNMMVWFMSLTQNWGAKTYIHFQNWLPRTASVLTECVWWCCLPSHFSKNGYPLEFFWRGWNHPLDCWTVSK